MSVFHDFGASNNLINIKNTFIIRQHMSSLPQSKNKENIRDLLLLYSVVPIPY